MKQNSAGPQSRSRLPWVLLGLVIAVIAGVTLYRQFHSDTDRQASSTATSLVASPPRVSPEQLRALAARSPGLAGPATVGDMAGMMAKRKRMAEATQARNQQRNAAMASSFAAEKADPAWSGAHEKGLASLQDSGPMHDAGAKAENFEAECRSSMCRIQADFPNQSMASDWLQLYMSSVGDRLPVATAHQVTNPDGSVRIEIYGVGRKR